jgi:tryptophan-rich sensory protein
MSSIPVSNTSDLNFETLYNVLEYIYIPSLPTFKTLFDICMIIIYATFIVSLRIAWKFGRQHGVFAGLIIAPFGVQWVMWKAVLTALCIPLNSTL